MRVSISILQFNRPHFLFEKTIAIHLSMLWNFLIGCECLIIRPLCINIEWILWHVCVCLGPDMCTKKNSHAIRTQPAFLLHPSLTHNCIYNSSEFYVDSNCCQHIENILSFSVLINILSRLAFLLKHISQCSHALVKSLT